jgi:hypothetical protein
MFETRTKIRRAARAKAIQKAIKRDREKASNRLREELSIRGVEDVDVVLERVYGPNNARKQR